MNRTLRKLLSLILAGTLLFSGGEVLAEGDGEAASQAGSFQGEFTENNSLPSESAPNLSENEKNTAGESDMSPDGEETSGTDSIPDGEETSGTDSALSPSDAETNDSLSSDVLTDAAEYQINDTEEAAAFSEEGIPEAAAFSLEDFQNYTVAPDETHIVGTVINLFDYWVNMTGDENGRWNDDYYHIWTDEQKRLAETGINQGHPLKFVSSARQGITNLSGNINLWTGNGSDESAAGEGAAEDKGGGPRQGIVQSSLSDGYPVLSAGLNAVLDGSLYTTSDGTESLAYLFDTETAHEGKLSFSNVGGLLQTDEDGYYYYDSKQNYAYFNEAENSFLLYNEAAVNFKSSGGQELSGQFFPFNPPGDVFTIADDGTLESTNVNAASSGLSHYFGLTMTTRFAQKNGGKTYDNKKVTYNFSGDDDVWVFIDDVLVADLGGLHDAVSLEIDFSTGSVVIYNDEYGTGGDTSLLGNNQYDDSEHVFFETTIKKAFEAAGKNGGVTWNGNTFADDTYHTLKFFYLERGNSASNLSLKFNLMSVPESRITKLDQEGTGVGGVSFALYPATASSPAADEYEILNGYESSPIWTGQTASDGTLQMLDEDGLPLTFQDLYAKYKTPYFILRETVPSGYHAFSDTYLYYNPNTKLTFSGSYLSTGTYASPIVTGIAPLKLYAAEDTQKPLYDFETSQNQPPEIFAVIFKRLDMDEPLTDENNWAPVSGSTETGWTVWDDGGSMTERIWQAHQANEALGKGYHFSYEQNSSAYQAEIDDLPGTIQNYYWYALLEDPGASPDKLNSQVEYSLNYYIDWGEGHASSGHMQRIQRLDNTGFIHEFSTSIRISNVKSYLVVEKVDENSEPMDGAGFSLYKAEALEGQGVIREDGTVNLTALEKIPAYDTGVTDTLKREPDNAGDKVTGQGLLVFPNQKAILEDGVYYLIETDSGNEDYNVNPYAVQIIVNDDGVFADAGIEHDGITTSRLVGSVLKSMLSFTRDDGVNATLHNLKVQLLTADEYKNADTIWSEWNDSPKAGEEQHLQYNDDGRENDDYGMEYSPSEGSSQILDTTLDTGWGRLEIHQCYDNDHYPNYTQTYNGTIYTANGSKVENLGSRDITNLFTTVQYVTVQNQPIRQTGLLTISKTVEGGAAPQGQEFTFELTLQDHAGTPLSGSYPYTGGTLGESKDVTAPADGSLTLDAQGKTVFTLEHGQTITLSLPAGITYTVTESPAKGYSMTSTGAAGTIAADQGSKADFTNTYAPDEPDIPDTPNEPNTPNEPDTPNTPDEPDTPDAPEASGSQNVKTISGQVPETGDHAVPALWIAFLLISLGGLITVFILIRKKARRK